LAEFFNVPLYNVFSPTTSKGIPIDNAGQPVVFLLDNPVMQAAA